MAYNSKSYRKFLATGATAALVATAIAPAASAAAHTFKDVNSNYEVAVSYLFNNNITKGYSETMYGTTMKLTRGNAAVIIANALKLDTDKATDAGFTDVNSRVEGAVNALVEAKILDGMTKTTFGPDKNLTRGQMAKILVNAYKLQDQAATTPFTDLNTTFAEYIKAIYGAGITGGKTPTTFGTNLEITRGEFANLLYKSIKFEDVTPDVSSVSSATSTSYVVNFKDAVKDGVDATKLKLMTTVELENGTKVTPTATKVTLSTDRKTATVEHTGNDLNNLKGKISVNGVSADFDYTSAKVTGVSAINASQIQVNFSQPVLESDVVTAGAPSAALTITPETVDGVASAVPGTLAAELSVDGKTLTLTTVATKKFEGKYTVQLAKNAVKAVKDGAFLSAYEGTVVVKDTTRPTLKGLTYNAAGTKAYLEFSESITTKDPDFSLTSVKRADGVAFDALTVLDATKFANSLTKRNVVEVDLAAVAVADENKNINISLVGLKDEAGNLLSPNPVSITVVKDTAVQAQATISSVKRTSVTNLEVTFDKELATDPTAVTIAGGASGAVTVSATNPKVYNVALTAGQQALTGAQDVTVTGFKAYNAAAVVTTPVAKIVDFTVEKVAPTITSTSLTKISGVDYLVVNLDEEVTLADLAVGTFTGTVSKPNGDLDVIPTVDFAVPTFHNASLTATKSKSVKINLSTLTTGSGPAVAYTFAPGTYSLDISAGIAKDSFGNSNVKKATTFTVSTSTAKLPAPTTVASKVNTPGVVVVSFANKVDVASAQTASNYSVEGATIQSAKVVTNTASVATVELSIASGTITHEGVRQVTVKNVKGFADSFAAMADYSAIQTFTENVAPKLEASNAVKLTATNKVVVDFDENLVDTIVGTDFDVYQNGVKVASTTAIDVADASKVVITLANPVASTSGLVVKAASTIDLRDAKYNGVVFSDTAVSN